MAGERFHYLDADLLRELHAVVVASRCAPKSLLAGIDPRFVASLDDHSSGAADLLATLHRLNETQHLADGEVPFDLWLGNASALLGHLPDAAAVVERAFGELRSRRPARDPPTGLAPSRADAPVLSGPVSARGPSTEASLVVIHHPNAVLVGEHRVLTEPRTRLGRDGQDVDWALKDRGISRQHCHIENRGDRWILRDLGSANGTWVNEDRIDSGAERELCAGDRIRLGEQVIVRFFGGEGAGSNRSRTLFHRGPVDELTGLPSRARTLDALGVIMAAAAREGRTTCVLAIHVDQMNRVDDDEWEPIGDQVLQDLARVLESSCPGHLVGRLGGSAFLVVPVGAGPRQDISSAVRSHEWYIDGQRLRVTVSIGVADDPDCFGNRHNSAADIVIEAEGCAAMAQWYGGDCAVVFTTTLIGISPPTPDQLMKRAFHGSLAVFGIGDEQAVIRLGHGMTALWQTQLLYLIHCWTDRQADSRAPGSAMSLPPIGAHLFKGHLFKVLPGTMGEVDQRLRKLREMWASFPVPLLHQRTLTRSLRCAIMSPEEVREHGERSFDVLLERLHQQSMGSLPFPLEALRPIAATHSSEYVRAKTLCDAIDAALRFITAVDLAALRDLDDPAVRAELATALAGHPTGQPLTMAAWRALALQLAPLAARHLQGPLREAARSLAEPLSQVLDDAVARSGRYLSRAPPQHESSYAHDRAFFEAVLDRVAEAMRPLERLRLVSVSGMDGYDEDTDATIYHLHLHQGPLERFPLVREHLAAKLAKNDWCYLIGAPEQQALLLAPIVAARPCMECGKVEVYMADGLVLGPKGAKVRVKAITTAHEAEVPVPSSETGRLLYDAVRV
jgi:diguanylate cyclase (GGDEF)-like protein